MSARLFRVIVPVSDVDRASRFYGAVLGEFATRPWGERSFYVCDPFGNGLCFVDSGTLFTAG